MSRSSSGVALLLILALLAAPALAVPVIANPGFEADGSAFAGGFGYAGRDGNPTTITGWAKGGDKLTGFGDGGTNIELVGVAASGQGPANNGVVPQPTHVGLLQIYSTSVNKTTLSTAVSSLVPGFPYYMTYRENCRTGTGVVDASVTIDVGGTTTIVPSHALSAVGGTNPYYSVSSLPFVATAASHQLTFVNQKPSTQSLDITWVIDDVRALDVLTGGTGPGGFERIDVPSTILYWLRGDAGVVQSGGAVSAWSDQTSRGNNFSQSTTAQQPLFVASDPALNNMPAVRFDGVAAPNNDFLRLATSTSPRTVFIVNTMPSAVGVAGIWGADTQDDGIRRSDTTPTTAWRGNGVTNADDFNNSNGVTRINGQVTNAAGINFPHVLAATWGTSHSATYASTTLGGYYAGRQWAGDMGEVVVFDRSLNSAETRIIENALGAKYGIALAAGDVYTGDDPGNGNYDLDVFGIGRSDASNQVLMAGSAGLGIVVSNGTLGDAEWVLAGHKTPVNSLSGDRWGRVWYLDKTGNVDVNLVFDFSDAGLAALTIQQFSLLYSAADPYSLTPLGLVSAVDGDRVSFTVPDSLLRDGYYTLGLIPEPATLSLLALGGLGLLRQRALRRRNRP